MEEILKKLEEQEKKIEAVYRSVERMRQYFKWTLIITIVTIVLPLLALAFIIPFYLKTLNYSGLGL